MLLDAQQRFRWTTLMLLAAGLCVSPATALAQHSLATDRAILTELYHTTNGPDWTNSTNWLNDEPLSTWYGVRTDGSGRVTALFLFNNALSGEIPSALGNLANLTDLWLNNNTLSGEIPSTLGDLSNLAYLVLRHNRLTGQIPVDLQDLGNLTYLDLTDNTLSGPIPAVLGDLDSLTNLQLGQNEFIGEIPETLGDLDDVTTMVLQNNNLTGSIPATLGHLEDLTDLVLGNNKLVGGIPADLEYLGSLRALHLYGNLLSGPIPADLGNLENLTYLGVDNDTGLCLARDLVLTSPFGRLAQELDVPVCNPVITVAFTRRAYLATEGGPPVPITIKLSSAAGSTLTIPLRADYFGQGVTNRDYAADAMAPATIGIPNPARSWLLELTVPANTTEATFLVAAVDDTEEDFGAVFFDIDGDLLPRDVSIANPHSATVILVDP